MAKVRRASQEDISMKLDKEEKKILKSVERGEWRRIPNFKNEAKRYRKLAKATLTHRKKNDLTKETLNKSAKGQDVESFDSPDEMFESWEK